MVRGFDPNFETVKSAQFERIRGFATSLAKSRRKMKLSGKQVAAARELLGLSQTDLATVAGVGRRTVSKFEAGEGELRPTKLAEIQAELERRGIEFTNGSGIGVRLNFEKAAQYARTLAQSRSEGERSRKLFGFLRLYRHELFDQAFQTELESMYRATGAGKLPCPPALLTMAMLLQGYERLSDADAVEHTASDARWQMVLDRMGQDEPAFGQGTVAEFRSRLIRSGMDRRVPERTVELAKKTRGFDYKKLPKTLRVAVDSAPLQGAGGVEDTINLLGHAAPQSGGVVGSGAAVGQRGSLSAGRHPRGTGSLAAGRAARGRTSRSSSGA